MYSYVFEVEILTKFIKKKIISLVFIVVFIINNKHYAMNMNYVNFLIIKLYT